MNNNARKGRESPPIEFNSIQIETDLPDPTIDFSRLDITGPPQQTRRRQETEPKEPEGYVLLPLKSRRGRSVDQRYEKYRVVMEHSLPPLAPVPPPQSKVSSIAESVFNFTERMRTVVAYRKRNSQDSTKTLSNQVSFDAVPWEDCPVEPKKCEKIPILKSLKSRSSSEAKLGQINL
ncbi:hypothetical protein L596_000588 [Steinernema carpocapsae]|uniref:Uncharacterized protein n=1 Tax=Steinernema carpocapsae TaxID=34508 RepID=A0A4U8UKY4_STECR|nr:hypothetical protein L596_000588 [Steinernema carpocapsae]